MGLSAIIFHHVLSVSMRKLQTTYMVKLLVISLILSRPLHKVCDLLLIS